MGWDALSKDLPMKEWWVIAESFVSWLEVKHPNLILQHAGIAGSVILEELQNAVRLEPLPEDLLPDRDFPEPSVSDIRLASTQRVPPTSTQLYRSLDSYVRAFGTHTGHQKFCKATDAAGDSCPHLLIETLLQSQHQWFYNLVKVENQDYDPSDTRDPPAPPQPFKCTAEQRQVASVTMGSVFSGFGSGEEALRTSQCGFTVPAAEQQPTLKAHLQQKLSKAAQVFSSAAEYLDKAQPRSVQLLQSSPPCPSHSTVNLYRQGNLDRFGGLHWQDSADYVLRILPANAWLECTLGVLRSTKGHASPMTLLNAAAKHLYWVTTLVIDAGRTASPATGRVSPLCHSRVHVIFWKKSCYPTKPVLEDQVNLDAHLSSYREFMDSPSEGKEYRVMPDEDFASMSFHTAPNSKHATVLAEVHQPKEGRGHYLWPNLLEDPNTGRVSVFTATSGLKWVCRYLNGKARATRLTNAEGFRMYCADGRNVHPSLLADNSQLG